MLVANLYTSLLFLQAAKMLSTADLKLLVEAKEAGSMFQRFFIPGQSNAVLRRRLQSWREPPTRRGRVREPGWFGLLNQSFQAHISYQERSRTGVAGKVCIGMFWLRMSHAASILSMPYRTCGSFVFDHVRVTFD